MIARTPRTSPPGPLLHRLAAAPFRTVRQHGAVVLAFHQIDTRKFECWIRLLRQHFELVSLDELVRRRLSGESLRGLLVLTFDDGWLDTCEPVAALCERERWPVTLYLVSHLCGCRTSLWFAELPPLVGAARGTRVAVDDWELDLTTPGRERATVAFVTERLKLLSGDDALGTVSRLRVAAGLPPTEPRAAFVGADFVRRYSGSRWVKFGSHTTDHQSLAAQEESDLHAQSVNSRSALEQLAGQPVRHFAYPYGAPKDYGAVAPPIVSRYYDSAVTMVMGVCAESTDLVRLPRVPLYNSDGEMRMIAKIALAPWM